MCALSPGLLQLAQLLGLPRLRGRAPLALALLIDALGTGLYQPFALLYFQQVARLDLLAIGSALTLATIVTLPLAVAGARPAHARPPDRLPVVDRGMYGRSARAAAPAGTPRPLPVWCRHPDDGRGHDCWHHRGGIGCREQSGSDVRALYGAV